MSQSWATHRSPSRSHGPAQSHAPSGSSCTSSRALGHHTPGLRRRRLGVHSLRAIRIIVNEGLASLMRIGQLFDMAASRPDRCRLRCDEN
jgi:hypothetical protein